MYGRTRTDAEKKNLKTKLSGGENIKSKKYEITTPDGLKFIIKGLNFFCKNFKTEKLFPPCLIACAKGKRKQHKGYKCRYLNEDIV